MSVTTAIIRGMETTAAVTGQLVAYSRVSTADQDASLQADALAKYGCTEFFTDTASGATVDRVELEACVRHLRKGDTLVIWRLDRLGRSLKHLLEIVAELKAKDVALVSLTEALDTSTPSGRLMLNVFGSLAEFERELIRERTIAGLDAARARGRTGGRKPALTKAKARVATTMYSSKEYTVQEIADELNVSASTIYRTVRAR
jgi:DNA invertase Pin-like site-specific DNA recombinase